MDGAEGVASREGAPADTDDSALVSGALALASSAHAGQRRKDGSPYIGHPQAVAQTLREAGFGDEVVAAAVLHDVVERSQLGLEQLTADFGKRVGDLVAVMTQDDAIPDYTERKRVQRQRVAAAGPDAVAIFAADKLANIVDLRRAYARDGERVGEHFDAGLDARVELWREDLEMATEVAPKLPYLRELRYELESLEEERAASDEHATG